VWFVVVFGLFVRCFALGLLCFGMFLFVGLFVFGFFGL